MTPRYVLLVKPITFPIIFPHTKPKQTGKDVIKRNKIRKKLTDNADFNFFMTLTGTNSAQGKVLPTDSTDGTTYSSNGKKIDSFKICSRAYR